MAGAMNMQKRFNPTAPDKGSFPLDHEDEVKPVIADDGTLLWNTQETPSESSTTCNSPASSNIAAPSASESTVSHNIVPTPTLLSTPPAPLSLSSVNPHQRGGKGKHSLVSAFNSESSLKITEEYYRWKMLDYQRQRLEVERERLAVEKERLAIESQRWEYQQFGECKAFKEKFMDCLKKNNGHNIKCRLESKDYLECRMQKDLMAKESWSKLGFADLAEKGNDVKTQPAQTT